LSEVRFARPRHGRVVNYDDIRGLGEIEDLAAADGSDGSAPGRFRFHSTAIADGSRHVEPGTLVLFLPAAGLGGVLEAREVTPLAPPRQ
jgi:hypothetical protein